MDEGSIPSCSTNSKRSYTRSIISFFITKKIHNTYINRIIGYYNALKISAGRIRISTNTIKKLADKIRKNSIQTIPTANTKESLHRKSYKKL